MTQPHDSSSPAVVQCTDCGSWLTEDDDGWCPVCEAREQENWEDMADVQTDEEYDERDGHA